MDSLSDLRTDGHEPPPGATIDRDKDAAIRRLLDASHALRQARQMSTAVVQFVERDMKLRQPAQAGHVHRVLAEEADQVFAAHVDEFADTLTPMYDRYFSAAEIEAMLGFYASALGQKLLGVMPAMMKETALATEKWARGLVPIFYRRAVARLRADGVEV